MYTFPVKDPLTVMSVALVFPLRVDNCAAVASPETEKLIVSVLPLILPRSAVTSAEAVPETEAVIAPPASLANLFNSAYLVDESTASLISTLTPLFWVSAALKPTSLPLLSTIFDKSSFIPVVRVTLLLDRLSSLLKTSTSN